jgi:4-amino-4-deoxy-L-arabinose transferase-like glycosyltransferase
MSPRLLLVLGAALWLWIAGFTFAGLDDPIGDGDEHVHATILRDMLRSGDYLRPRWQGALVLERPLLPYWLAAPFSIAVPGEVGVRLSSALASFATLLVVFAAARAVWKRADVAFVATLLLAGSPSFHAYSRTLMSDPLLVLGIAVATASALLARREPRWLIGVAFGIGFGIAAKTLIAVVPVLGLLPWLVAPARRLVESAHGRRSVSLVLAALAVTALPYYVLETALHGEAFLRAHFGVSLAARATADGGISLPGGHAGYLLWIPRSEGPLAALWLSLGSAGALVWGWRKKNADLALLGAQASTVLVLMSLLATRLPHYLLPAYPAAALAVAGLYAEASARLGVPGRAFSALLGPALAMAVLLEARAHPGGYEYLLQRAASRDLGVVAQRVTAPQQAVYAYEWYGPALAYYAERPVRLLTEDPQAHALVSRFAVPSRLVPPPPEPAGSQIVVSAEPELLSSCRWLRVEEVLARSPPIILVRARVLP